MFENKARFAPASLTFKFLQIQVKKEINRGHRVEAVVNYYTYSLQPLLELLGMVYRPYRYDFRNAKYFSRDFPPEVVARVVSHSYIMDLADLARKQDLAELLSWKPYPCSRSTSSLGMTSKQLFCLESVENYRRSSRVSSRLDSLGRADMPH